MAQTQFCTVADVSRLFSSQGVRSFSDHDQDGNEDTGVVTDCIIRASGEIEIRAKLYTAAALATSQLVTQWAATLAVFYLCQRRGNSPPSAIEADANRIFDLLNKVADGLLIPDAGAPEGHGIPVFSNPAIVRGFGTRQIRVDIIPDSTFVPKNLPQDRNIWTSQSGG